MMFQSALFFLLIYFTRESGGASYGDGYQSPHYATGYQQFQQPAIKRYHPTTYSKESTEEETAAASVPQPQAVPQIQYAYQGGDAFSQPDYQNVPVRQGEVFNNVRQEASGPSPPITPRPHPVYQQAKPQPAQSPPPTETSQPQGIPPEVLASAVHNINGIEYDPNQHFVDDHDHHHHFVDDHDFEVHHGFDGYDYGHPIHHVHPLPRPLPPPPPPQKSKATQSSYAYYYIGRHLWYVPLYFSIYFIAYVGLLVLQSIARHKVLYPALSEQAAAAVARNNHDNFVLRSIEQGKRKYYMR